MVPTLVHNSQPVRESSVINQYIDAAFEGPKLRPSDPLSAARMHEFVYACDEGFSSMAARFGARSPRPNLRMPALRLKTFLIFLSAPLPQDHGSSENNLASRRFRSRRTCSGLPHWERINFGPPIAAPELRNGTGDYQGDPHFKPPSLGPTSPVAGMRRSG